MPMAVKVFVSVWTSRGAMTMQFRFGYSKGRVVGVESGPDGQPEADLGVLMGGVVVDDQMNVQIPPERPGRW